MISLSTVALRLAIALAFGSIIGVEREWRQKNAGLKTMALVALGAAAFAMMSDTFGPDNHNPGMLAAAVVGGIGFIGAGVIMHRGFTVQGVTTAATLWANASVGVAAGLGQYPLALVLTGSIVAVQLMMRRFEKQILRKRRATATRRIELRIDCDRDTLDAVNETLASLEKLEPLRRSVRRDGHVELRVEMLAPADVDLASPEKRLVALPGVRRVDVRHLGFQDDD